MEKYSDRAYDEKREVCEQLETILLFLDDCIFAIGYRIVGEIGMRLSIPDAMFVMMEFEATSFADVDVRQRDSRYAVLVSQMPVRTFQELTNISRLLLFYLTEKRFDNRFEKWEQQWTGEHMESTTDDFVAAAVDELFAMGLKDDYLAYLSGIALDDILI